MDDSLPRIAATEASEELPSWRSDVPVRDLDSLIAEESKLETRPGAVPDKKDNAPVAVDSSLAAPDSAAAAKIAASPTPAAGKGTAGLRGIVLSAGNSTPVADALVIARRDSVRISARTDTDGLFRLGGLAPGAWKLTIYRKGYESRELEMEAKTGEERASEIILERRILKGQVVQAKVERKAGSAQDILAKRQQTAGVMEGVSAEQIAKSTDSDAGAVARRLTGTSLVGGKYIYVRGLGERYTNMTLNGLPVPSPEKDKRVVPQDLFPAGALESFSIYKTFVPDLYSDFAGGSVALVTKGIPEKAFFKATLTSGNHYHGAMGTGDYLPAYMEQATKNGRLPASRSGGWQAGVARLTYDGGNTFWGIDDGTRSLPDGFPGVIPKGQSAEQAAEAKRQGAPGFTPAERAELAMALPNTYGLDTVDVTPPANFSLSAGNVFPGAGGGKFGYLLHAGFKNKYDQFLNERQTIASTQAWYTDTIPYPGTDEAWVGEVQLRDTVRTGGKVQVNDVYVLQPGIVAQIEQGFYEAQLSGMANLRYENEDWAVWWKNFLINIGTDRTYRANSYQAASGAGASQDKLYEERYLLDFNRRFLYSGQVGGEAYVGKSLLDSLTWAAGLSSILSETPDSRRYRYTQNALDTAVPMEYYNNDIWGTRIFEDLSETALAGRLDAFLIIPPEYSARDTFFTEGGGFSHLALPTFTAGLAFNTKHRNFAATRYSYDKDRGVYPNILLEQLREPEYLETEIISGNSDFATSPKDYDTYEAGETQVAAYLAGGTSVQLWRTPFGLDGGLRLEGYDFRLKAPYTGTSADHADIKESLREFSLLPTVGLWTRPWQPLKLRTQFARTMVRPEFREMAPFQFSDFVTSRTIQGNPDLKKTEVDHYDLRADWFLPYQQSLSASLFYKDFKNPVETIISIDRTETYQNAGGAYVKGVEFEANLSPGHLLGAMGMDAGWLEGLRISGNFALMESEVRLRDDTSTHEDNTSFKRPMVGQAPYLVNLSAMHEYEGNRFGFLNAVLFNVAGERIRYIGTNRVPDIMEIPFPSLESLHRVTWYKRNELGVRVKNWLGASKELRVKEDNDKRTYNTVTREEFGKVFGNIQRYHTYERTQDALWVEVTFSRQF